MSDAMQPFTYTRPETDRPKRLVRLARSDILRADVQIVREGGENNLHSHSGNDGFWYVLAGSATFYSSEDDVVGELSVGDGVLVPRGAPYWFESSGTEPLEILHVAAYTQDVEDRRTDHTQRRRRSSAT